MRSLARQSARLAPSTRSGRLGARQRHESCNQQRSFHQSIQRAESRPPNNDHEQHTPLNGRHEPQKTYDNGETQQNEAGEQDAVEAKSTSEIRKHGMRRTLRQKRMHDVPKPPPIPEWFLQHNVRLHRDSPGLSVSKETGQVIRCVDAETGHTLFTVPYYEAWPHERDGKTREAPKSSSREPPASSEESAVEDAESQTGGSLEQNFFNHKYQTSKSDAPIDRKEARKSHLADMPASKTTSEAESNTNPLRWAFLETETSIRAAFSLASSQNQHSSSFATDRLDLSLQCADLNSHEQLDEFVQDVAKIVEADLIRLDANDFSELAEDYVGQGHDEPGSYSTLAYDIFDGHTAHSGNRFRRPSRQIGEENDEDEMDEDEEVDEDDHQEGPRGTNLGHFSSLGDLRKALQNGRIQLGNAIRAQVVGIGVSPFGGNQAMTAASPQAFSSKLSSAMREPPESNRDDERLAALLDCLLDAPKQKMISPQPDNGGSRRPFGKVVRANEIDTTNQDKSIQRYRRYWRSNAAFWMPSTAGTLVSLLNETIRKTETGTPAITLASEARSAATVSNSADRAQQKTIVHVRDLRDISNSPLGQSIINRLVKVVRKRRRAGEQIIIFGTTAQDVTGPFSMAGDRSDDLFRAINVPPFFNLTIAEDFEFEEHCSPPSPTALNDKSLSDPAHRRILDINLRHMQKMLRRLRPDDNVDLLAPEVRGQLYMPGMHWVANKVLSLDEVQQYVLLAIGLSQLHAVSGAVKPIHIALAGFVIAKSSLAEQSWTDFKEHQQAKKVDTNFDPKSASLGDVHNRKSNEQRMERLKKSCNQHESRLLSGMVDPHNIKTSFTDVQAPQETIEALKILTTLSLLRPDAFRYGVLAEDRLPGLLLYGPPGTGKTLLAKAVAKESKATVLEVTGAQIYEKYVGEGEKMVRAVFSLAKKLAPCVVFIDEADAILGARSNGGGGNRNTHREIINQFLREWDGMDSVSNVFMMVASNRPFDLDDAVLRRLPRRLLVDLPVKGEREGILGIHLKNEHLDESVSLGKLAEQTPLYSGSDLKNVAVAAALACVREENELVATKPKELDFKLPEKRTLSLRHFEKALEEVSASISEDMSSLSAIRKFDEQYGDRKGRGKKKGYGFGVEDGGGTVDEGAARVRQPTAAASSSKSSPPPPI